MLERLQYMVRLGLARLRRLGRLIVFAFELLVLSRLFARHGKPATAITAALLKTKAIECLPPDLVVTKDGEQVDAWTHGFTAVNASLFLNLRNPDEFSAIRHALPAPPFRAIYLWDSAFIAQVWNWWDANVAWDVLRAVMERRAGDRLQHYASEFQRSAFTQPPLIGWSLARLADSAPAEDYLGWVREAYPILRAYHAWLAAHRRLDNGLYAWAHTYESGVENAPRFSSRDERRLDDTRFLAAPDFSTYMVLHCEALAFMARALGDLEPARLYEREAYTIRTQINDFLWDEESGLYFDRDVNTGEYVRTRTIASLLPLWCGAPSEAQAERMLEHILDPEAFNTLIPLPSVALNDPSFERDMWRGPVWINMAFAVIEGLRRYGFHQGAARLAFRLCDGVYGVYAHTHHFYEFYDPTATHIRELHRKRGNRWKRVSLGSKPVGDFVGWTGLVNTLVTDTLFGLRRAADGLTITPRFPPQTRGMRFCLTLPREDMAIDLKVTKDGVQADVRTTRGNHTLSAAFGETVSLHHTSRAPADANA